MESVLKDNTVQINHLQSELANSHMELGAAHVELELQSVEIQRYQSEIRGLSNNQIRYQELFESAPIGYMIVDSFLQIIEINPAGAALLGKRRHQIIRTPLPLYVNPDDRDLMRGVISRVQTGAEERLQLQMISGTAKKIPTMLYMQLICDDEHSYCCQIAMMDISEHREAEEQLRNARDYLHHVATHDSLTGLPNRRHFTDVLEKTLIAARRQATKVAVLMLDLDQFKYINDTLGHEAGDVLLSETAKRLQTTLRPHDIVARLGGDEFTVILTEIDQIATVESLCEALRLAIAAPYNLNGHEVRTAASIGVCVYPTDSVHGKEMVKFADAAMYQAKSFGRNCVRFFTADLSLALSRRFSIETDLRAGIKQDNFNVWYQPICCSSTGKVVGIEALARWHHPERGLVSPAEFISIAEECGAIEPLGYLILSEACEEVVKLQAKGFEDLLLSVNISPRQFAQPGFASQVREIIKLTGLNASSLELEVTESVVFHDDSRIMQVMNELMDIGVRFAIDDFGTGYSSFARLRRLPISKIKIDQSFVKGLPHDADDCAIAKSIISMARDLGLVVVSEGVEEASQLRYLKSIGCDLIQGYLIGEPMPAKLLRDVLQSARPVRLFTQLNALDNQKLNVTTAS